MPLKHNMEVYNEIDLTTSKFYSKNENRYSIILYKLIYYLNI